MIAVPFPKVRLDRIESMFDDTRVVEMLLWRATFVVDGIYVRGVVAYRLPSGYIDILFSIKEAAAPLSPAAMYAIDRKFRALIKYLERP